MRTFAIILLTAAVLLAVGCEGEQGPAGPSGDDGNANVVTGTISPTNAEWLWSSAYWYRTAEGAATGYFTRYVNIPLEELTPEFISTGVVLVSFMAEPSQPYWTPLPFHFPSNDRTYLHTHVFEVMEGLIRLHYFNMPTTSTTSLPSLETWPIPTYTFKYTLIEGTTREVMEASGVDVTDYEQVMEFLEE